MARQYYTNTPGGETAAQQPSPSGSNSGRRYYSNEPPKETTPEPVSLSPAEILSGATVKNNQIDAVKERHQQSSWSDNPQVASLQRQSAAIRNSAGRDDPLARRGLAELENEIFKIEDPAEYARREQAKNAPNLDSLRNQKNDLTGKRQEAEVGLAMAYTPEMVESAQAYIDGIDEQIASIDEQIASFEQPQEKRNPFNADPRARVDANTVVNVRNQLAQVNSQINELQTGVAMTAMSGVDTSETEEQITQLEQQRDYLNGQLRRYEATLQPQFEFINEQIAELTNRFMNAEGDERNEIGAQLEFLGVMQNELMRGLNISERPLVEWDGRQELVDEFQKLSRSERSNPAVARRLQEVRRLLEEGDTLAGNGVRSYSFGDAFTNFMQGGAKRIGSSLSNAFATWFDAYSRGMSQQYTLGNALTDQAFGIDPMSRIEMQTADYTSEESQALRQRMYDTADKIGANATEDLERVKRGMSKAGKTGVDIAENILEMGFDAGVGAMTGGGSLPSMFIRVFGSSAQEARQNGASLDQQMAYGLTKAGIEVATEKMFDGVAKIYGAGAADEITEKLIGKLAETDTGRTLLRLVIGAQGEGVEEVVSDLLDPLAKSIYSDKSVSELYADVDPADILYSYLIGTAVGMIGGGTNIVTGGNAAANYELRQNESERRARNLLGYNEETGLSPTTPAAEETVAEEPAPETDVLAEPVAEEAPTEPIVNPVVEALAPAETRSRSNPAAEEYSRQAAEKFDEFRSRQYEAKPLYEEADRMRKQEYDLRKEALDLETKAFRLVNEDPRCRALLDKWGEAFHQLSEVQTWGSAEQFVEKMLFGSEETVGATSEQQSLIDEMRSAEEEFSRIKSEILNKNGLSDYEQRIADMRRQADDLHQKAQDQQAQADSISAELNGIYQKGVELSGLAEQERRRKTPYAESPTETVTEALAPTVNNESETEAPTVNEESVSKALVPETAEETAEAPAQEEAPAEETAEQPAEETSEETAEESPKERTLSKGQQRVVDMLSEDMKNGKVSDQTASTIMRNDTLINAVEALAGTEMPKNWTAQVKFLNSLAQDISQYGSPDAYLIAKMAQDNRIQSTEQELQYQIDQLTEQIEAAELEGDSRLRAELAKQKADLLAKQKAKADAAERKGLLNRIGKSADDLAKAITRPSDKHHVRSDMSRAVMDFVQAVNSARDNRTSTREADIKASEKFDRIAADFDRLRNYEDPDTGRIGEAYSSDIAQALKSAQEMMGSTPLSEMTNEDLEAIDNTFKALNHAMRDADRADKAAARRSAYESGHEMERETKEEAKGGEHPYAEAAERPETFFNRLAGWAKNSEWHKWYERLNKGMHKVLDLKLQAQGRFNSLIGDYKNYKTLRNEVTLKGLTDENGNKVKISRGMMLSLYLHLQNAQNTNHISGGGITIADIADYYHARHDNGFGIGKSRAAGMSQEISQLNHDYRQAQRDYQDLVEQGENDAELMNSPEWQSRVDEAVARMEYIKEGIEAVRETEADRIEQLKADIENELTDYERRFLEAAQDFFKWAQGELNATTEEVYGFKKALVDNYFPISTDSNFRNVSLDESARMAKSLENAGMMQQRVNSNSPMLLLDITDVLNGYINQMAQYCGAMPVVREFNKVWNTTESGYAESLRNAVSKKFGNGAVDYVDNLIKDLQGARASKAGWIEKFLNTTRGNFAASVLTLNARVAGSQAASWFNAASVVGWDNLAKSIGKGKPDLDLIRQYSPLLAARSQGKDVHNFSDLDQTVASQRERITKKFWFALNWINDVDNFTVSRLWNAAEQYVQNSNSELAQGTDEYYKEVGRVFDEVVERTQPSYQAMQRSGVLRDPRSMVRSLTMFMTQRLQNYNEVTDRIHQAIKYQQDFKAGKNGVTEADVKAANKAAFNSVTGTIASSLALTAMKAAIDGLLHRTKKYRDKETGELTWGSLGLKIMDYTAESLFSNALFGAELYQAAKLPFTGGKYYGTSVPGVDTISDTVEDILKAFRASKEKRPEAITQAIGSLSALLYGVPYDNIKGYVESAIDWADDFNNGTILESDNEYTTAQNKNIIYDALLGGEDNRVIPNGDRFEEAKERMGDDFESEATAEVKVHYDAGEIDFGTAKGMLQQIGLTEKEADDKILEWHVKEVYGNDRAAWEKREDRGVNELDRDLRKARESESFQGLGEDEQKKVLDTIYGYHKHLEKAAFAEENGIEYENETYEKYEDLDDPVARIVLEQTLNPAIRKDKKDPSEIANPDVVDALVAGYRAGEMSEEDTEWFEAHDYVKDLIAGAELDKPIGADDYFDILDFVNQMAKWNTEAKKGENNRDTDMIDASLALFAPLLESDDARAIFNDSFAWTDELLDAREIGMDSELFFKYFDQYNLMKDDKTLSADEAYNKMYKIVEDADDLTREQKELLHERFPWTRFVPVRDTTFEKMVDRGMDTDYAEKYVASWAELTEKKRTEKNDPDATLSATEKARVIWSDTTLPVNDRLQMLDYSNILPSQHDFAVWLSTSGLSVGEIHKWWSIIGAKNSPKPWSTSYEKALKKKS